MIGGREEKKERFFSGKESFNAFLGEGTLFKGILSFEGTVRIDGRMEGEIVTKDTLVIGETAQVQAVINAGTVVVSGTVRGDILASKKVEILSTGKLFGNISSPVLSIEEGVVFEGSCTMGREAAERSSQKGQPAAAEAPKK
jgi:cytoskeletal protein CcmA (bactofilin family)